MRLNNIMVGIVLALSMALGSGTLSAQELDVTNGGAITIDRNADAISRADSTAAWEASSSAAGALMMLARVQQDLNTLLTPPRLQ